MPKDIVTARVTQEQYNKINQLVSDGVFNNRSIALQTFVELGLKYCNFGEDTKIVRVTTEYKERALAATREATVRSLVTSIVEELSNLIEMKSQRGIIDSLTRIKSTRPLDMCRRLMELLEREPIYQVAQRMVKGE